jgi:ABC-type transport system involved in cytochrome bd biosynthesis fused ATPase/permease subunit
MNTAERIFTGFSWLWARAREPLIGLALSVLALLLAAAFLSSPLALLLGLAVLLLSIALAWLHGDRSDSP